MPGIFGGTFEWTHHSRDKMRHYRLTEARVKRIIRHPTRMEEGVLDEGIAVMQPAGGKEYSEIWAMYLLTKGAWEKEKSGKPSKLERLLNSSHKKIRVITAWRYPGKSPARDPIPEDILREIKNFL